MKILMTSDTFLPSMGGAEMHILYLSERLVGMGHELKLFSTEEEGVVDNVYSPLAFSVIRQPWTRFGVLKMLFRLWRLAQGVNVVHAHYSYRLGMLAGLVSWSLHKPFIVTLHGLGTLDEPGSRWPYKQAHAFYRFLSLNLATKIIATSEDMVVAARPHLLLRNRAKLVTIFNGVDTKIFSPDVRVSSDLLESYRNQKVILTVRRLVPKNGIHFLVEAMPDLIKLVPNVKYLMIGTGRMESYIRSRVEELGLGSHVEMLGFVDNKKVSQFLKLSDVVVFPSTAESSSIACAEAMAMGKPIVASRVGGLTELIGPNEERGHLVTLVDWQDSNYEAPISLPEECYGVLSRTIADCLNKDQTTKTNQALEYARSVLDWSIVARKTQGVYETVSHNEE